MAEPGFDEPGFGAPAPAPVVAAAGLPGAGMMGLPRFGGGAPMAAAPQAMLTPQQQAMMMMQQQQHQHHHHHMQMQHHMGQYQHHHHHHHMQMHHHFAAGGGGAPALPGGMMGAMPFRGGGGMMPQPHHAHHHHMQMHHHMAMMQMMMGRGGGGGMLGMLGNRGGGGMMGNNNGGGGGNNDGPRRGRGPQSADDLREKHSNTVFLAKLEDHQDVALLRPIFARYGDVAKIDLLHVKRYAFIHYRTKEEAINAVDDLLKTKELGPNVRVDFGNNVEYDDDGRDLRMQRGRREDGGGGEEGGGGNYERQRKDQEGEPSHVLYVGSLPARVSDADLARVFERFSGYRAVTRNFQKECAFVHYMSVEEAGKALEGLRGQMIDGARVKIAFGRARELSDRELLGGRRTREDVGSAEGAGAGLGGGGGGLLSSAGGAGSSSLSSSSGIGGALMALPQESSSSGGGGGVSGNYHAIDAAAAVRAAAIRPAYYTRNRGDALLTIEQKVKGLSAVSYFYCGVSPPHLPVNKVHALIDAVDATVTSADVDSRHRLVVELEEAAQARSLPHAFAIIAKRLAEHFSQDHNKRLHVYYATVTALFRIDSTTSTLFGGGGGGDSGYPITSQALENLAWLAAVVAPHQDERALANMRRLAQSMSETMKKPDVHDDLAFELLSSVLVKNNAADDVSSLLKRLKKS